MWALPFKHAQMMIVTSSWISREGDLWVKLRIYLPLLLVTRTTFDFVDAEKLGVLRNAYD